MKLSEIYGMSVSSADDGADGYVIKIYTDGKKIIGLLCADERENEFYVQTENARFAENKIIFADAQKTKPQNTPLALGRKCYNASGEFVGILKDINCRGFNLKSAKIGAKNYAAENLIFGDVIIINLSCDVLKTDVVKGGSVLFKSGEKADKKMIARAISLGEYVQTNLKKI